MPGVRLVSAVFLAASLFTTTQAQAGRAER